MCVIQNTIPPVGAANLESQLSMAVSLASTTLESVNRLTGLNVNLARATLEHSNLVVRQLMSAEDRDQLMSVVSAQAQPNTRRSFDYAYYLTTIVTSVQMDFIHILGEGVADTTVTSFHWLKAPPWSLCPTHRSVSRSTAQAATSSRKAHST
jgi:phasin family protein